MSSKSEVKITKKRMPQSILNQYLAKKGEVISMFRAMGNDNPEEEYERIIANLKKEVGHGYISSVSIKLVDPEKLNGINRQSNLAKSLVDTVGQKELFADVDEMEGI